MNLVFTWKELIIRNGTKVLERYPSTCKVRNELNGKRKPNEVIYTTPKSGMPKPFYPRQYPSGIFKILSVDWLTDPESIETFGPVLIRTDATRNVYTWDLDVNGNYWTPTGNLQLDAGYHIHHTHRYKTTHGCIRGGETEGQMISIAQMIEPSVRNGDNVYVEVL
jgi:hypothetical protein